MLVSLPLILAIPSLVNVVIRPTCGNTNSFVPSAVSNTLYYISILDIVKDLVEAMALEAMLESSSGHSYIKPELEDVD